MNIVTMKQLSIGYIFVTNEGYSVIVVSIKNNLNITVKFNDRYCHVTIVTLGNLNNGKVKNPYHPSVCKTGFMGVGTYRAKVSGKPTLEYIVWSGMLYRCYGDLTAKKYPTYADVKVCEEWYNFQNFAHWYCNTGYYNMSYELDKDLLFPGNRVYSPNTCCMVPQEINNVVSGNNPRKTNLPTGVYQNGNGFQVKIANQHVGFFGTQDIAAQHYVETKQLATLELANKWKDYISNAVYLALINLQNK